MSFFSRIPDGNSGSGGGNQNPIKADEITIQNRNNQLTAVAIENLGLTGSQLQDLLSGTEGNIQTQIDNLTDLLGDTVSSLKYRGAFETYSDLTMMGDPENGDLAVVLTDEDREGQRSLRVYSEELSLWQFMGAFGGGIKGEKGDRGERGERGLQGVQGVQGVQGEQGATGEKGDTGKGLELKGAYQDSSELPSSSEVGDTYLVDGRIYVYDGDKYVDNGNLQGEKGERGEKGDTGDSAYQIALANGFIGTESEFILSLKGEKGDQGIQGAQGAKGEQGEKGDTGLKGDTGDIGETGERGLQGDQGIQGIQGVQGEQGNQGLQGVQGEQGIKGDTGDSFKISKSYATIDEMNDDFNNPDIPEGAFVIISSTDPDNDPDNSKVFIKNSTSYRYQVTMRGLKGEKGDQGIQGVQGVQGEKGAQGDTGEQGIQGLKGDKGSSGKGVTLKGSRNSESDLPITGENGDAYWVDSRLYIWSDDPHLVAEPTWLRGSDLQGIKGDKGDKGDRGDGVDDIGTAMLETDAQTLKEAINEIKKRADTAFQSGSDAKQNVVEHISKNATKTEKGHMQVGDGLKVDSGIVSVVGATKAGFDLDAEPSSYDEGTTHSQVVVSSSDEDYRKLTALMNQVFNLNMDVNARFSFRYLIQTHRYSGTFQTIDAFFNLEGNRSKAFSLTRAFSSSAWTPWVGGIYTSSGKGNPNGQLPAFRGATYCDIETGLTYKMTINNVTSGSNGWEVIGGSPKKEYISMTNSASQSIASGSTEIHLNRVLTSNMTHSTSRYSFTLKGGKTYRITATLTPEGVSSGGNNSFGYSLYSKSGTNLVTTYGRTTPASSSSNSSSGIFDTIYAPVSDIECVIRSTGGFYGSFSMAAGYASLVVTEL